MSRLLLLLCLLGTHFLAAQNIIRGMVHQQVEEGANPVLPGASIYWHNTDLGTVTDKNGMFSLERHPDTDTLVVSFVGFQTQMFIVQTDEMIHVTMEPDGATIGTVDVVEEKEATEIKLLLPTNTQIMNQKELRKAACCSLSESFETNPAVDASFTDAVTGTRQIKMLGLDGKYTMITQDNLPSIRGFSVVYGLELIPGPWIESIHVSKGAGSVVNGFESMTGQINVGMWRPENAPKFHLNLFASGASRLEANAHYAQQLSDKWSTIFMGHLRTQAIAMDRNGDNFIDAPLASHAIFRNEWGFRNEFMESQFGANFSFSRTRGGEIDFDFGQDPYQDAWGAEIEYRRLELFMKAGFFMPNSDYNSIGLQLFFSDAVASTFFGSIPPAADFFEGNLRFYDGTNRSVNANVIYMGEFSDDSPHTYKTGISYSFDDYSDDFWDRRSVDPSVNAENYAQVRVEHVPGIFYEYAYQKLERISLIAGIRYDHHNQYGGVVSPRAHLRYSFDENHALKFSLGRGFRTANVFMENLGLMANSRIWSIRMNDVVPWAGTFNYNLKPEMAWNMGVSFTKRFTLDYRDGNISVDAYHTRFEDQVLVDMDDARSVRIYNLEGESWSNSFQVEANYEVVRRMDVRLAYRYLDVQADQIDGRFEKVFNAPHRWFMNIAYQTRKKEDKAYWLFDLTYQHIGSQRLPITSANPSEYQLAERSPAYPLFNGQITLIDKRRAEWYLGVENLFNYKQDRPILSAEDPHSDYFDASMIWGPVFGRMLYAGMRWTIE
jgi:outer membrane receptor for ferrienterochelin and colicin